MTQHSRDDALSARQFERLLQGARDLPSPQSFEARLVILLAGRLGMRGGEIAHLHVDWIDMDRRLIEIPNHDPCKKGRHGGVCGYCRDRAREHLKSHNLTHEEAREVIEEEFGDVDLEEDQLDELAKEKMEDHNKTLDEALEERWQPKTENGSRAIPFDFDTRTLLAVEEFAERYQVFPKARVAINRRVSEATEAAGIEERVYPHALRATAASSMALRDVSAHSLMGIMGWADLETARTYVLASDETAAMEIRSKYR
ncbi:MAG: tyrosine-type recombinase/integrase [archaeon]